MLVNLEKTFYNMPNNTCWKQVRDRSMIMHMVFGTVHFLYTGLPAYTERGNLYRARDLT